jgi:hypothetical protein
MSTHERVGGQAPFNGSQSRYRPAVQRRGLSVSEGPGRLQRLGWAALTAACHGARVENRRRYAVGVVRRARLKWNRRLAAV